MSSLTLNQTPVRTSRNFKINNIKLDNIDIPNKLDKFNNAKDRVTYTINFNLTKIDNEWTVDNLNNEDLEKIHGIYAH